MTEPIKAGKYYRCMNGSIVFINSINDGSGIVNKSTQHILYSVFNKYIAHILYNTKENSLTSLGYSSCGSNVLALGYTIGFSRDPKDPLALDEPLIAEINFYKTKNHGG